MPEAGDILHFSIVKISLEKYMCFSNDIPSLTVAIRTKPLITNWF